MPDFTPLSAKKDRQVRLMRTFKRKKREFELRQHLANASIHIAETIIPNLDDSKASEVRIKGRLLARSSGAHMRLSNYPGALRFCELRIKLATEWLQDKGVL
jgi:hypothetical protein